MWIFLLLAVLLAVAGGVMIARRKRARRRAAELKAARLRALRKPSVPFVSASLRGMTTPEPPRPAQPMQTTSGTSDRAA